MSNKGPLDIFYKDCLRLGNLKVGLSCLTVWTTDAPEATACASLCPHSGSENMQGQSQRVLSWQPVMWRHPRPPFPEAAIQPSLAPQCVLISLWSLCLHAVLRALLALSEGQGGAGDHRVPWAAATNTSASGQRVNNRVGLQQHVQHPMRLIARAICTCLWMCIGACGSMHSTDVRSHGAAGRPPTMLCHQPAQR